MIESIHGIEGKLALKLFRVKKTKSALVVQLNRMLLENSFTELGKYPQKNDEFAQS